MPPRCSPLIAVAILLIAPATSFAVDVRFPLTVDYGLLEAAARARWAAAPATPGEPAAGGKVWRTADGCHSVRLDEVHIDRADDRVRISARGVARAGFPFWRFCLFPLSWDGYLDTRATPEVGSDWQLRLRDVSSEILDRNHRTSAVASRIWDLVKGDVEEDVRSFSFDLRPPADEARAIIRDSVAPERAGPVLAALDSLRPIRTRPADDGIEVEIAMDAPPAGGTAPAVPEPPLAPSDLERWQAALERLDSFLVFVVKDIGVLSSDTQVRDQLFALLFDSRQELLAALADTQPAASDRVRATFLADWERLRVIVRDAARRGELRDRGLRYLSFLAAGDALTALDTVGPWLGLEISADGLRRLARLLEPDYQGDPLQYSDVPDPTLRELFRFHEPESAPAPAPPPEEPETWWWPGARAAFADGGPAELAALTQRLERWIPDDGELDTYRDAVGRLLDHVAAHAATENDVDGRLRALYGHLVRAVAWQESCWRQYVRRNGKVTFLLSKTGDVGMMQVNRRVWRGFFDLQKLEWNVAYNAGAGAEILAQLLTRYGVREATDGSENAARATYSAYNGGPGAYRRYRGTGVPRALRAIDQAFRDKYRAMADGRALDYVLCVESWGEPARLSVIPSPSAPTLCRNVRSSPAT